MKSSYITTYTDIDWHLLWQNGRKLKSWNSKNAEDWNRKAPSFAKRVAGSPYVPLFLSRLPITEQSTILDLGCGPGTLSLPLAPQVRKVTALDYSQKMLDILQQEADAAAIDNIRCINCSWESDWDSFGVEPADIVLASRSMNVDDLSGAIDKLQSYAKEYVFISDRIAPSPFDPDAFAAIDRPFDSGPDYIFTLNILYTKSIHANVEILELEDHVVFKDREEALNSYIWMFKELSDEETTALSEFIEKRIVSENSERIILDRPNPPRWALIWWKKK